MVGTKRTTDGFCDQNQHRCAKVEIKGNDFVFFFFLFSNFMVFFSPLHMSLKDGSQPTGRPTERPTDQAKVKTSQPINQTRNPQLN